MVILNICRVCMKTEGPLFDVLESPLQVIFEKITNLLLNLDCRSHVLCLLCRSHMRNAYKLIQKAQRSEEIFANFISDRDKITDKLIINPDQDRLGLCLSKTETTSFIESIPFYGNHAVKAENSHLDLVKEEEVADEKDGVDYFEFDTVVYNTESDDDELLINIKDRKRKETADEPVKKRNKIKKDITEKGRKGLTALTKEVFVCKEDQLKELLDRSSSKQYLNASYKCSLCYKGFIDEKTFENHQRKHDLRSGDLECDVCRLRYYNDRQLKSHVKSSHSTRYECQKCQQICHTASQAREHEKWHNGFLYICQICGHESKTSSTHLTHKRKCYPDMQFVCNICGASFVAKFGLKLHKSKAHKFDDIDKTESKESKLEKTCGSCSTEFLTKQVYIKHLLHCKKSLLKYNSDSQCPLCKEYLLNKSLPEHLKESHLDEKERRIKTDNTIHSCQECSSVFKSRVVLAAHVKHIHLGIKYNKNVVCETCGKNFRSNAQLRYHQRSHTGERPFPCLDCGRSFSNRNQLRIHGRRHTGEKPYRCHVCERTFSQKAALNRHARVHTGAKPYSCTFCSKAFSQSSSLRGHINQVHLKIPYRKQIKKNIKKIEEKTDDGTVLYLT